MNSKEKKLLTARVHVRMSSAEKEKLRQMLLKSHCHRSISELIRHLLFEQRLTLDYRNASQEEAKTELIKLHNEVRKIGVNINQLVRYFHRQTDPALRQVYTEKSLRLYEQTHTKIYSGLQSIAHLLKT